MTPTGSPIQNDPIGGFEADTIEAVSQIRDAYARIIEFKCPGSKAVSALCDAFGIHRKLAWQLTKVAYSDDPYVASKHIPPSKSNQAWLDAARANGIPDELVRSAKRACDRFENVIETHAANKSEFDMMVESFGHASDVQSEVKWRQHAFTGNSYTLGAHCRVLLGLTILMPSENLEDFFHAVQVRGVMGFRQTRPDVRWVINQSVAIDDDAKAEMTMQRAPLAPEAAAEFNGVPVLPEFCSNPMPALLRTPTHDGMMQDEFLSSYVGLQGERTLVTGEIMRNIGPTYATPQDKIAHFGVGVRTPAEMLHFDLYVKAGLFGDVDRELRVFSDLASPYAFEDKDALCVSDQVAHLNRGVSLAQAPDLPGYSDLVKSVFGRIGVDPAEYELYRIRMAYPPLPTTVMMKHELLPQGKG